MKEADEAKNVIIRELTEEQRILLRRLREATGHTYNNKALLRAGQLFLDLQTTNSQLKQDNALLVRQLAELSNLIKMWVDAETQQLTAKNRCVECISQLRGRQ